MVTILQTRDCLVYSWLYRGSNINMKLTEEEVRQEFRKHRKDKVFAKCWSATNDSFYEWCSLYLDYQHITKKNKKKLKNTQCTNPFSKDEEWSSEPELLQIDK